MSKKTEDTFREHMTAVGLSKWQTKVERRIRALEADNGQPTPHPAPRFTLNGFFLGRVRNEDSP